MDRFLCFLLIFGVRCASKEIYQPTWDSLDSRPLPEWYDRAKIGIFVHWGVYSVPSFGTEWFWSNWIGGNKKYVEYMRKNYPPGFTYQEFAKDFRAEFFDPNEWVELFNKSGAKYVVLTSKHHEGFTLWPSKHSFSWNAKDVGAHRDLVGELADAIRNTSSLHFGLYHSLYEWFNPLFLSDKENNLTTDVFVRNKVLPELYDLVRRYKPEIVWSDGEWEAPDSYWQSKKFLAWLYNDNPVRDTVVTNDRWGSGEVICKHGGFFTCADRFNPGVLQPHKWENAMTIDKKSWGFRLNANLSDYISSKDLVVVLTQTVSCGGNLLMNVGPTKEGIITPIYKERLLDVGEWLSINGEAIYDSEPWLYQNDTIGNTWFTSKKGSVYAIVLEWPRNNIVELQRASNLFNSPETTVILLGNRYKLKWEKVEGLKIEIQLPDLAKVRSKWGWVLKIKSPMLLKSNY